MKLYGSRLLGTNSYYIPVNISIPSQGILGPVTFLMDTGCEITTINYGDARYLNIHNISGKLVRSRGIGGVTVNNVQLYGCAVYYFPLPVLNNYTSVHFENLNVIHVSKPTITQENYDAIMALPSLLGMDFLRRYKICFEGNQVTLEK
jgi:hypothetical protein